MEMDFTFRSINIRGDDFERLKEECYLNDNVMDFYWEFLKRKLHVQLHPHANDIYFFNSHFHTVLSAEKQPGALAKRWERNIQLLNKSLIFIPFNEDEHWLLFALVGLPQAFTEGPGTPLLLFLDSFPGPPPPEKFIEKLASFFQFRLEYEVGRFQSPDIFPGTAMKKWKDLMPRVPTQENESDCGVYVLHYAELMCLEQYTERLLANAEVIIQDHSLLHFERAAVVEKRGFIRNLMLQLNSNSNVRVDANEAAYPMLNEEQMSIKQHRNLLADKFRHAPELLPFAPNAPSSNNLTLPIMTQLKAIVQKKGHDDEDGNTPSFDSFSSSSSSVSSLLSSSLGLSSMQSPAAESEDERDRPEKRKANGSAVVGSDPKRPKIAEASDLWSDDSDSESDDEGPLPVKQEDGSTSQLNGQSSVTVSRSAPLVKEASAAEGVPAIFPLPPPGNNKTQHVTGSRPNKITMDERQRQRLRERERETILREKERERDAQRRNLKARATVDAKKAGNARQLPVPPATLPVGNVRQTVSPVSTSHVPTDPANNIPAGHENALPAAISGGTGASPPDATVLIAAPLPKGSRKKRKRSMSPSQRHQKKQHRHSKAEHKRVKEVTSKATKEKERKVKKKKDIDRPDKSKKKKRKSEPSKVSEKRQARQRKADDARGSVDEDSAWSETASEGIENEQRNETKKKTQKKKKEKTVEEKDHRKESRESSVVESVEPLAIMAPGGTTIADGELTAIVRLGNAGLSSLELQMKARNASGDGRTAVTSHSMSEKKWLEALQAQIGLLLQTLPKDLTTAHFSHIMVNLRHRARTADLHHYVIAQWQNLHPAHAKIRKFAIDLRTNKKVFDKVKAMSKGVENVQIVQRVALGDPEGYSDQNRHAMISIRAKLQVELSGSRGQQSVVGIYVLTGRRRRLALQLIYSTEGSRWICRDLQDQSNPKDTPFESGTSFDTLFKSLRHTVQQSISSTPIAMITILKGTESERELYSWDAPPMEDGEPTKSVVTAPVAAILGQLAEVVGDKPRGYSDEDAWTAVMDQLLLNVPSGSSLSIAMKEWLRKTTIALCPLDAKWAPLEQLYNKYITARSVKVEHVG